MERGSRVTRGIRDTLQCVLPIVVFALALSCTFGVAHADGIWLPENISTLGERIDRLWTIIFVIVTIMFVTTQGALVYLIIRYRRREGKKAIYFHDHKGFELGGWIVPGAVLVWLALYQWGAWADAKIRVPDGSDVIRIQVYAQQFEWNVRYAGPDGRFATADDVTMKNQMYIPEGRQVLVQMRAMDVIHSFFLPNLRVKQDVMPGTTSQVWFDATKTGTYEIACSELCGLGHYRMRGRLYVYSASEFESWLQEKYDAGTTPADWGWDWEEGV